MSASTERPATRWPRRPWPRRPQRDDAWLSKRLAAALEREGRELVTVSDWTFACAFVGKALGCDCDFHARPREGRITVFLSKECPGGEVQAAQRAFNDAASYPLAVHVAWEVWR